MKEKIAILMSSYNGIKYIKCQIDSILKQKTDCDLLLVIRDDGSTDGTVEYVQKLYKNDSISIISGKNIGYVSSFFELINYAKNKLSNYQYFALADQDDRWDDDKLQTGVDKIREIEKEHYPILYASVSRLVDDNLHDLNRKIPLGRKVDIFNSIIQNFLPGHNYIMNHEMLNIICNANPERIYVHDSFILNAAVIYDGLIYDETAHTDYRQHTNNQLGGSSSFMEWLAGRLDRVKKGDGKKYATQIEYIYEYFNDQLSEEARTELSCFLGSRKSFWNRLRYIFTSKLYRQKLSETIVFKLYYLVGGYN